MASAIRQTWTMGLTSWTRTMSTPLAIATATVAAVLARVGEGSLKLIVAGEWHGVALI